MHKTEHRARDGRGDGGGRIWRDIFYQYEISQTVKLIETKSRIMVTKVSGQNERKINV